MVTTWYGDDSPHLSVAQASQVCARVTGKVVDENGQNSGEMGGSSPWTRPSGGSSSKRKRFPGRYRLGHRPVVLFGDDSMYSQAIVKA